MSKKVHEIYDTKSEDDIAISVFPFDRNIDYKGGKTVETR